MWSVLTNTTPHGWTIMYVVTPATGASMVAVGHVAMFFDPRKNGLQLADDCVMRLKNEFASDDPDAVFSYLPSQDDDAKRLVQMCSLEIFLLQNVNMIDKVIIIADTQHTQRFSERKADLMLCNGDLAFFCKCVAKTENMRLWAQERTPSIARNVEELETVECADVLGAIAEDHHLNRCAQVAERHDHGKIDEVLGDQDMEEGRDVLDEADREADLLEQLPLPGHPESEKERLAS